MRIEPGWGENVLDVDVQTKRSGSGAKRIGENQHTAVTYGGLYAQVTLKDMSIRVTMNPVPGDWHNLEWAREKAIDVIRDPAISPLIFKALHDFCFGVGVKAGRASIRAELRELLSDDDG